MTTKLVISAPSANVSKPKPNKKINRIKINKRKARKMYALRRRAIPVAYSMKARSSAVIKVSDMSASLTSTEIFPITASSKGCSLLLPVTPTKWSNTRTNTLASTYDSFRPLKCNISWEPAVSTSTPGSVAIGTVFAGCRLPTDDTWESVSQGLAATNGGLISTVWDHSSTTVKLQKNLRSNLFPLYNVDPDDIPFWICVASNVQSDAVIGYLIVNMTFTLRNPAVPGSIPPLSGSGKVEFTKNEDNTVMSVSKSFFNRVLTVGQDVTFAFASRLLNSAGVAVVNILDSMVARLSQVTDTGYQFSVDSQIAAQQSLGYVIGVASNF